MIGMPLLAFSPKSHTSSAFIRRAYGRTACARYGYAFIGRPLAEVDAPSRGWPFRQRRQRALAFILRQPLHFLAITDAAEPSAFFASGDISAH